VLPILVTVLYSIDSEINHRQRVVSGVRHCLVKLELGELSHTTERTA
jgi:hypothetical protein